MGNVCAPSKRESTGVCTEYLKYFETKLENLNTYKLVISLEIVVCIKRLSYERHYSRQYPKCKTTFNIVIKLGQIGSILV